MMTLIKDTMPDVTRMQYKRTKNQKLLEAFRDSGMDCARVEGWTHVNAKSCRASLANSIKNLKMYNIQVFERKGEVYLVKKKV